MGRIKVKGFKVQIIESEKYWGQKVDEEIYFDNEPAARAFVKIFNSNNNLDYVPDYYERAEYCGKV